jgi:hypothetical protein
MTMNNYTFLLILWFFMEETIQMSKVIDMQDTAIDSLKDRLALQEIETPLEYIAIPPTNTEIIEWN